MAASLAVLAAATVSAAGGARGDAMAAARRLRERASAIKAVPDTGSGLTRDVGQVAVIEHDGSTYDASDPDGTPSYGPRAAVARRFYETHGDLYDFLVVFTNFDFDTRLDGGTAIAFHNLVRNDVRGNGSTVADNGDLFGSPGRLLGYIDMANVARYGRAPLHLRPDYPLSVNPGDPGFRDTLDVLAHEMAHQWLAYTHYRDASGQLSSDLLDGGHAHWRGTFDSDASVMYGADWAPAPGGAFTARRVIDGYSSLDLYLMGLLAPERVSPMTLLRGTLLDPDAVPIEGAQVAATAETIDVGQIVSAEGARTPGSETSPKAFRLGFIFLTQPGVDPDPEDLQAVERIRQAFAGHFFALTRGIAIADTTLAEEPSLPPAAAPDLQRAREWLLARQLPDGSWQDSPATAVRDTVAVLQALAALDDRSFGYQAGHGWAEAVRASSVDFLARRATVVATGSPSDDPRDENAAVELLAFRNPDGGFGAGLGYTSDPLDTALALRALRALHRPLDDRVRGAIGALAGLRSEASGWPFVPAPGARPSTVATASVLLALEDWGDAPEAQALLPAGLASLLARQNADGGFGESPSTPYASALALEALLRAGAPRTSTDAAIAYLQRTQLPDGSWRGSGYETALVLGALGQGVAANLVVPADRLVVDPAAVAEGTTVHVSAVVRNQGRSAAAATHARLFAGDPRDGQVVGEAEVPPLEPAAEAPIAFDVSTADRAGVLTLFVAADADHEVAESREDDNVSSRAVTIAGRLPDLALEARDVVVSPYPPEEGETAQIAVTVANMGRKAAPATMVRVTRGNPRLGGQVIAELALPALAVGQSATLAAPWDTTGAVGNWVLFASADADYRVAESDETNNEASVPVRVVAAAPAGPDLEVASLTLSPSILSRVPQTIEARAVVRNLGRERAVSTVALYDADPPSESPIAELPVDLPPRSSMTVAFTANVTTAGARTFVALADPRAALEEADETNNRAAAALLDPANTLDLEITTADVTASATDVVIGQPLTITAIVHNHGTADARDVIVQLGLAEGDAVTRLAEAHVAVPAGSSAVATLTWTTSQAGDPLTLAVRVDPFHVLPETSETNNDVALAVRVRPSERTNLRLTGADVSFDPPSPLTGTTVAIAARVSNTSTVPATAFTVRFFRDDPDAGGVAIGESRIEGLAAGTAATATIPWLVDGRGSQGIFVVADAAAEVDEYDETDNRAFRPIAVIGRPDLVLAAADVRLDPAFPRAGEAVSVQAVLRNLGGQPSGETTLVALDGEPTGGAAITTLPIPALDPGGAVTLSFSWTPADRGSRTLSLVADPAGVVVEQDEGNNVVRRSVAVQDASLYLTEPFFSPDGDGVKDETVLGYRAGRPVSVLVIDAYGRAVRTLIASGPAEGSVAWDGRDDRGLLLGDGTYTIALVAEGKGAVGRIQVVLDTNRSTLHDAAANGRVAAGFNLTCGLDTSSVRDVTWMPAEDELLLLTLSYDVPPNTSPWQIVRVGIDGSRSPLPHDATYSFNDNFISGTPVSPDGREVLVRTEAQMNEGDMVAVDLATGARRLVEPGGYSGAWSPDSQLIATPNRILRRDGSVVTEFTPGQHGQPVWSPDGSRLAMTYGDGEQGSLGGQGTLILGRDGTELRRIPMPPEQHILLGPSAWRGDGRIVLDFSNGCGEGCSIDSRYVLDPDTGVMDHLAGLDQLRPWQPVWSPDGKRLLYLGGSFLNQLEVATEDGSSVVPVFGFASQIAPGATGVTYYKTRVDTAGVPGTICAGKDFDLFAAVTAENLTAAFDLLRLPGNDGLLVRGTVADRALERFQLDYMRQDATDVWHPIGAASEVPVVNDVLAVWVPPSPGTFLVRLTAADRAGNVRMRTRLVSWDRVPVLANVTQTEFLISPNDDGVKDAVTVNYLVEEPTDLEVRIVGPSSGDASTDGLPVVRAFHFDYPSAGPQSFTWDGRDVGGGIAADGRYTILVNDIPLRVDVDATPPEIAWRYENLRADRVKGEVCHIPNQDKAVMRADRVWHVVDAHLKSWDMPGTSLEGTDPIFEPERDASGAIVLEHGVPRILTQDGRPADRRDPDEAVSQLGVAASVFEAVDHGGNRASVPTFPVDEKMFVLDARVPPPDEFSACPAQMLAPIDPEHVYALTPNDTLIQGAETRRPPAAAARFEYKREGASAWTALPALEGPGFAGAFKDRGFDLTARYAGRFVGSGTSGDVSSEEFKFRPCGSLLQVAAGLERTIDGSLMQYAVVLDAEMPRPIASASFVVSGESRAGPIFVPSTAMDLVQTDRGTGAQLFRQTFVAPPALECPLKKGHDPMFVIVRATDVDGKLYENDSECWNLIDYLPHCPAHGASFDLDLTQEYRSCESSSPDRVSLVAKGSVTKDAEVAIGPDGDAPGATFSVRGGSRISKHIDVDVTGRPEGELTLFGTVSNPAFPDDTLRVSTKVWVDRTPPAAQILQPADGSAMCVSSAPTTTTSTLTVVLQAADHSPRLDVSAELKQGSGPWRVLERVCLDKACEKDPSVPTGIAVPVAWDVTDLPSADYTIRLTLCDRAGNRSTVERSFVLTREAPAFSIGSVSRAVFSPNGDGRSDDTTVRVKLAQSARLSASVVAAGGATVRTLMSDHEFGATDAPIAWDGRGQAGDIVSEGAYRLVVSAKDACGQTATTSVPLEVDLTPPSAQIDSPTAGAVVGTSVDVMGHARDVHFASYELSVAVGADGPPWTVIGSGAYEVAAGSLGHWDAPGADAAATLRLVAVDQAENQTEIRVPVTLRPSDVLARLGASPVLFSPNGDGRRETTTITYELKAAALVRLAIKDTQGQVVRTLEAGAEHAPGVYAVVWDGRSDAGAAAADGDLAISIRLEDPAGLRAPQEAAAGVTVDRAPPVIVVDRPASGAFLARDAVLHGRVDDAHLSGYVIEAQAAGRDPIVLSRGSQERTDFDLASLALLTDGSWLLVVTAQDGAENRAELAVPVTVDSVAPAVALSSPRPGAILRRTAEPVDVTGLVQEAALQQSVLSFGAGRQPASFVEIARGTTTGTAILLGKWGVSSLPDGEYTLRLAATDRAGQSSEARLTVVLDGAPPEAEILSPAEGEVIKPPATVTGTAADATLETWTLEAAPGSAGAAVDWLPVATGTSDVRGATLGTWSAGRPDGPYTLRLSVADRAGQVQSRLRTVLVDTMPPAAPTGLAATVTPTGSLATVVLTWNASVEPDLAGYRVSRDGQDLTADLLTSPAYTDRERPEGEARYTVIAVDRAGNASPPAALTVRVDLTPPIVGILRPGAGERVSGVVEVRGSALSPGDFKEYRLLAGAGTDPVSFTLLARSTRPVTAGTLGTWTATVDGPYVLALEAEDASGNRARTTVPVIVDNQAPGPPVLLDVAVSPMAADTLTSRWEPSPSADVAGYLVYRNGALANAGGVVLGSLRAFAVPGPTYDDVQLPDGRMCYRIVAIDQAGNTSTASNEICGTLDNRAPHATIVQPADGTRFDKPLRIVATTPDADVASVQFQVFAQDREEWTPLGSPRTRAPYEVVLDSAPLTDGYYFVQAVATDQAGHVDAEPGTVFVIRGDSTAPLPPPDVVAHVDGGAVTLAWSASTATDLAGYHVFRDGVPVSDLLTEPAFEDPDVALGPHDYTVTAVDGAGNESAPSAGAPAVVYAVTLDWQFPVTTASTASLSGGGARPGTTVELRRDDGLVAEAQATAGRFTADPVPLAAGLNVFTARGRDGQGNRSLPSAELPLISNAPPTAVTGLDAPVTDHEVDLSWTPVGDEDVFGYRVTRDREPLTGSSKAREGSATTDARFGNPADAFDGNLATSWNPFPIPATLTLTFPAPVLVESVQLQTRNPARRYSILARVDDHLLPLVVVEENTLPSAKHTLPTPIVTDTLAIRFESFVELNEVTIVKTDLVPAATTTFHDTVADGIHRYEVTAVDRYGAEGAPGAVEVTVGDAVAPAPPTALAATIEGRDVRLTWTASPDADVDHYVVRRDGNAIATSGTAVFVDAGRPNGTYVYVVRAVDGAGNQGLDSNAASATVGIVPSPPAILFPTDAAHPITLDATRTDVRGTAEAGSLVELSTNGEFRGATVAVSRLALVKSFPVPAGIGDWDSDGLLLASPDGSAFARVRYTDHYVIEVVDRVTGETRTLDRPDQDDVALSFSPDSRRLLFVNWPRSNPPSLWALEVSSGEALPVSDADHLAADGAWTPDGEHVAYFANGAIWMRAMDETVSRLLLVPASADWLSGLSVSADGKHVAYFGPADDDPWTSALHLGDLATGQTVEVARDPALWRPASWSADGRRVAFTSGTGGGQAHVLVYDLDTAATRLVRDSGASFAPAFDPGGRWLSFLDVSVAADGRTQETFVAERTDGSRQAVSGTLATAEVDLGPLQFHTWPSAGHLSFVLGETMSLVAEAPDGFELKDVRLDPGSNVLVARAVDPALHLTSADSEPVLVTAASASFPDLAVDEAAIVLTPAAAVAGRPAVFSARVSNQGAAPGGDVPVRLTVSAPDGSAVLSQLAQVAIPAGAAVTLSTTWTPLVPGLYRLGADVDEANAIVELREDNNAASRDVVVQAASDLVLSIGSDRAAYPARTPVALQVRAANGGPRFAGTLRTLVEDVAGREVAVLDDRNVSIDRGQAVDLLLDWNTATVYAGDYVFRVRARGTGAATDTSVAFQPFRILPDSFVWSRITADGVTVPEGASADFALRVENRGSNVPLTGLAGRLRIVPAGSSSAVLFETEVPLPALLPGAAWDGRTAWPAAGPPGSWRAVFEVHSPMGAVLASSASSILVEPAETAVSGTLGVAAGVLAGSPIDGVVSVTNQGTAPLTGYPLLVQVVEGGTSQVLSEAALALDLPPGETRTSSVRLATAGVTPGRYPMFLRHASSGRILDRTRVRIHGAITAPSVDSPADGATVDTDHPVLRVNDATIPDGGGLAYEFQVFADPALSKPVTSTVGVAEAPLRTGWRVDASLAEDQTFYWRARATDGFSVSSWTPVAAMMVDSVNYPPAAPVPDSPAPGATVASRQPLLVVTDALDPEQAPLRYEFRLAGDAAMASVIASATDVAEGLGLTSWRVPIVLDGDATYFWSARASDGLNLSAWSTPIAFTVHTVNRTPTPPTPLAPAEGAAVATRTPALVVGNAHDPEGDTLSYRFEIDRVPSFDSPALQVSPDVAEGSDQTSWTPGPLADNTRHYWRAAASDGHTASAFAVSSFVVNLANDPPGTPVTLDPVDGRTVHTATPELRARNTTDVDGDVLRYDFEVTDAAGAVVASSPDVTEGLAETTWTVATALAENGRFSWRVRARDAEVAGEWSPPAAFRVDAVAEPPTAPVPVSPAEGARLDLRQPRLVVGNASSPDGLALTYAFEVYRVATDGSLTLVDQAVGLPEGVGTTSWMVSADLADGSHAWRARASDGLQAGPWMASAHFSVSVDVPPAPPTGLAAVPGDASVALSWRASAEPDVVGYRVYRAPVPGGPFVRVGSPAGPSFLDRGLTNGVTVYYAVTAIDARFESAPSAVVAATPVAAPPTVVVAEVRFDPAVVDGECLLADPDVPSGSDCRSSSCPESIYATVELPRGFDPSSIDVSSVRLAGSVPAAAGYFRITDVDHDGVPEAQLRFRWAKAVGVLAAGANDLTVLGRTPTVEFHGTGRLEVRSIQADLHVSPQTLSRRSHGSDVEAQITLCCQLGGGDINPASLRLNGRLAPTRIVSAGPHKLIAKFDRAAVIAILPVGEAVEVRVTGTVRGVPFEAKDVIRVTQ